MKKLILTTAALALAAGAALADSRRRAHGHRGRLPAVQLHQRRRRGRRLRARAGRRALRARRADLRMGHQRLGFDHPQPRVGQLRHDHRRHVDHRRARRGHRLHPELHPARPLGLRRRCRPTSMSPAAWSRPRPTRSRRPTSPRTAAPWSSSRRPKKPSPRCATARPTRCWPTRPILDPIAAERAASWSMRRRRVLIGGGVGMGLRESDTELQGQVRRRDPVDEGRRHAERADRQKWRTSAPADVRDCPSASADPIRSPTTRRRPPPRPTGHG